MISKPAEFALKIAETPEEIKAAQKLRYQVFVEELGAQTDAASTEARLECDIYDAYFDHLILQDKTLPVAENVVGVYRMLRDDRVPDGLAFYSANEFHLDKIITSGRKSVELGRSCVDARYRGGVAMHLLWSGLADYVSQHNIEILFGVASFHGTDPDKIAHALSFLYHNHLAPETLRVTARGPNAIALDRIPAVDIDRANALKTIPPLIKSYLRFGGRVGAGAYIDHAFNTIDVCLVMDTANMVDKYKSFYNRDSAA